jgi:hypothetical protein
MKQSFISDNMMSTARIQDGIGKAGERDQSKMGRIDGRQSEHRGRLRITEGIKVTVEIGIQSRRGYTKMGDRR